MELRELIKVKKRLFTDKEKKSLGEGYEDVGDFGGLFLESGGRYSQGVEGENDKMRIDEILGRKRGRS